MIKDEGKDAICEMADDCLKVKGMASTVCQHRRIHKRSPLCNVSRCSVGGYVTCVPPTDGQIVMQKLLDTQDEVEGKKITA